MEKELDLDSKSGFLLPIFEAQKSLMDLYIKNSKLVHYPLDLKEPENWDFIRSLVYYLIEELCEVSGEYIAILGKACNNDTNAAEDHLKALNFELADVAHFLFEFLIFLDVDDRGLLFLLNNSCNMKANSLWDILNQANSDNMKNGLGNVPLRGSYVTKIKGEEGEMFTAGVLTGPQQILDASLLSWDAVQSFVQAIRLLDSKPWKSSSKGLVDYDDFYKWVGISTMSIMRLFAYYGWTSESFYANYIAKNRINIKRISDGY